MDSSSPPPVGSIRALQIITFAMAAGVLAYAAFALFINKFAIGGQPDMLSWIGFGFGGIAFLLHLIIPRISTGTQLRSINPATVAEMTEDEKFQRVFAGYQTGHIIACALLEAPAFLNVFAYQSTSYLWSLVVALVLIGLILLRFPTVDNVQFWAKDRVAELEAGL